MNVVKYILKTFLIIAISTTRLTLVEVLWLPDCPSILGLNFQDPATVYMEGLFLFNLHVLLIIIGIVLLISWLLIIVLTNFTEINSSNTAKFTHSDVVEIIWTSIPAFILLGLASPSFALLYSLDETVNPELSIKIEGHQWYWSYHISDLMFCLETSRPLKFSCYTMPNEGLQEFKGCFRLLETNTRLLMPARTSIRLLVTSIDVLHSWAIPSFGIKVDALSRIFLRRNYALTYYFFKEQLKYLKTNHSYHLVDVSPWPIVASLGALMLTSGLVLYMNRYAGGFNLMATGFFTVFFVMFTWWRDLIREATLEAAHSAVVQKGLKLGVVLFIVSEFMFFFAFFWAFFHSSVAPTYSIGGVWPPKAITTISTYTIPLTNTFILLTSGATVTWAHHALIAQGKKQTLIGLLFTLLLASLFTSFQGLEYISAPFCISDGVYGSCFYITTGFHGFHVFVGAVALFVSFIRVISTHFTSKHHLGFESAIWYWHFVDVIWLFVLGGIYWWGNSING